MLRKIKFTPLQIMVHIAAWSCLAWVVWEYFFGPLNINPIQTATQHTGKLALIFLVLALACTPLNTLFGFRQALKVRRALGLYAFSFASMHFLLFSGVDFGFDWSLLKFEFTEKRYILVGLAAGSILISLAVTSFKWWMKRLGKNWKRLHRLVYLAGLLVITHYSWAKKGDLLRLQGDILQPLIFGLIVVFLLVVRIPSVRKGITNLRGRIKRQLTPTPA